MQNISRSMSQQHLYVWRLKFNLTQYLVFIWTSSSIYFIPKYYIMLQLLPKIPKIVFLLHLQMISDYCKQLHVNNINKPSLSNHYGTSTSTYITWYIICSQSRTFCASNSMVRPYKVCTCPLPLVTEICINNLYYPIQKSFIHNQERYSYEMGWAGLFFT